MHKENITKWIRLALLPLVINRLSFNNEIVACHVPFCPVLTFLPSPPAPTLTAFLKMMVWVKSWMTWENCPWEELSQARALHCGDLHSVGGVNRFSLQVFVLHSSSAEFLINTTVRSPTWLSPLFFYMWVLWILSGILR